MSRLCRPEDLAISSQHFARRVGPGLLWSNITHSCRADILLPKEFVARFIIDVGKYNCWACVVLWKNYQLICCNTCDLIISLCSCLVFTLTLLDMGRPSWTPKIFLTTVSKHLGGERGNLVTFNINLWTIKESYFWFLRLSGVTMATSLLGST